MLYKYTYLLVMRTLASLFCLETTTISRGEADAVEL